MEKELEKKVDGTVLAQELLASLTPRVSALKKKNITPKLAVIQVGDKKDSSSYIRQKRKIAKEVGAEVTVKVFPTTVFFQEMAETIHAYNADPNIHGIIIQRPLPPVLSTSSFNTAIIVEKDVDGFRPKSEFSAPIALAVMQVFRHIYQLKNVTTHLKSKQIVIIGRGETAGKPIAELLSDKKIPFLQSHSKTDNIKEFTEEADIIISCVGKPNVISADMIKEGAVLLGVGIHHNGRKLIGDYNEQEIAEKASFYTPTPGGLGPLNIAYLLSNLVTAAERQ